MTSPRGGLNPAHPLHQVKYATYSVASGDIEVGLANGLIGRGNIGPATGSFSIAETRFEPSTSTLQMTTVDGHNFTFDVGFVGEFVDRPVVYLDQNHWIDLARAVNGSSHLSPAKQAVCHRLIELARERRILLPLSAAHLVETAKKSGRQRLDVARLMVELV